MSDEGIKTILLVEDQAIIALKEANTVQNFGYKVETVHTGEAAVSRVLEDEGIDLILMDIDLGSGIDGTEAARQILAQRSIPIVFLTSHAEEEYVEKAREITRYGYVLKNSGDFVLRASIEMAFELFESHQQIYEAKEEFRTTLYSIGDGVITTDRQGVIQHINPQAEKLTGYSEKEVQGSALKEIFSIINENSREEVESPVHKVIREGNIVGLANHTLLLSREGKEIPITDSGAPIKNRKGEIVGVVLVFQDQSQERRIQNEMAYRQQQFRRAELNASLGHWELDLESNTISTSQGARYLYGLPDQETFDYEFIKQIPLYEYRKQLDEEMRRLLEEGKPYDIKFKLETYDTGELRDIHSTAEYDPDQNHVFGIVRDITERMNVERTLQHRNHQLKERIKELNYLTQISKLETDTHTSLDTFIQRSVELLPDSFQFPHITCARILLNDQEYITGNFTETEWSLTSDIKVNNQVVGTIEVFYTQEAPEEKEGPFLAEERSLLDSVANMLGYYIERRRNREELELSQYALEHSAIGIFRVEEEGQIVYVNNHVSKMLGYTKEELLNMTVHDIDADEDADEQWEEAKQQIEKYGYTELERRHQKKDGSIINVLITTAFFNDEKYGRLAFSFVKDITRQKEKEKHLRESEQRYYSMFENNQATILLIDPDHRNIVDANPSACAFYGYSREQLKSMTIDDINLLSSEKVTELMQEVKQKQKHQFEFQHQLADGTIKDVLVMSGNIRIQEESLLYSIIFDITQRKQAERRIEQLLNEKEVLLKEVHHRIKNNMSTISSLLLLRSNAAQTKETALKLKEAENEVRGMQLLYDKLYRAGSEHYKEIKADEYFNDLVDEMIGTLSDSTGVTVSKDIDNFVLDTRNAFPVAIIINELLSNAIKHAFNDLDQGRLRISAQKEENGQIQIVVEDNGSGLPEHINPDTSEGFGFQLINAFTKQLNGDLQIDRNGGTTFLLKFSED